jgi:hypothetical protein
MPRKEAVGVVDALGWELCLCEEECPKSSADRWQWHASTATTHLGRGQISPLPQGPEPILISAHVH